MFGGPTLFLHDVLNFEVLSMLGDHVKPKRVSFGFRRKIAAMAAGVTVIAIISRRQCGSLRPTFSLVKVA
jgi:hypothetical protein